MWIKSVPLLDSSGIVLWCFCYVFGSWEFWLHGTFSGGQKTLKKHLNLCCKDNRIMIFGWTVPWTHTVILRSAHLHSHRPVEAPWVCKCVLCVWCFSVTCESPMCCGSLQCRSTTPSPMFTASSLLWDQRWAPAEPNRHILLVQHEAFLLAAVALWSCSLTWREHQCPLLMNQFYMQLFAK